jgi:pyruvate dehydrogenase (quinone)
MIATAKEPVMASTTVGDQILSRLREWGVEHVFGYPGDGINGILAALGRADNQPQFVQSRHEEMSAFQATGYAKFTGRVGVCMATSGPGAIHLLNGLYDAKLDHTPVVAIVGQQARTALGGHYQQEVDLHTLFKDVAGDFVEEASVPQQFPALIDRALRIAASRRTVTAIIVPSDLQDVEYSPPEHAFKMVPTSMGYAPPRIVPPEAELRRAAEVLNAGKKVAILAGAGARVARREVIEVAERLGAGVAKALVGKDAIPDDLPFVTGPIGLLGSKPSYDLMMGCDTLLMVGTTFPYTQFMPELDQARAVQIDIDPAMLGLRYPTEVNLHGDSRDTLRELLPLLHQQEDTSWREDIEAGVAGWWETLERRAMTEPASGKLSPLRVFHELSPKLPSNAIVTSDSGSAANWYARYLVFKDEMRGSLSGTLATMGPGVPYAIGAKFAHPDRPAFALVGDGAMQMNGLAELITIQKYYRQWSDPRLVVMVLHNNDLNQVTWEMRAMGGFPKVEETQNLPDVDYAGFAEKLGLRGIRVEKADDVAGAWDAALAADRPVVIDAVTDPEVPPIPPHASAEQVKELTGALLKGDPSAWQIVATGAKEKVQEFLPGEK